MLNSNYIVNSLAAGFTRVQVAEALQVTPSAITQHIDAHGLEELIKEKVKKRNTIDMHLEAIETKAWEAIKNQLSLIGDPMKLLRIAQVANAAKRRSDPAESQPAIGAPASLRLPQHVTQTFVFNSSNEAVAIGDRMLVTLPAADATKLLKEKQNERISVSPAQDW